MFTEDSFGSAFRRLDDARHPDALLDFLDRVAAIPMIHEAKEALTQRLTLRPGDRVLDVGCGTGIDLLDMLAPTLPGGRVVGIDTSARAIEVAGKRFAEWKEIVVQVADAHALPHDDRCFDVARVDRVLLHLDRPDDALAEIRRVLVPGGRVGILEMIGMLEGPDRLLTHPVHVAVRERFWRVDEQRGRIELFFPLLHARAGLVHGRIETHSEQSTDFDAANVLLRMEDGVREAVAAGILHHDDGASWLRDLQKSFGRGTVSMRIGFTSYTARTPGSS